MPATRITGALRRTGRIVPSHHHAAAPTLRASLLRAQPAAQQRAAYAIPPHDKENDDLGGPYGQESPNPEHRKRENSGFRWQAAAIVTTGIAFAAVGASFFTPRQIANYQIDHDTVIGGYKSNTGEALARVKRKEGVKTTHQLHQEMTQSSELGNK